MRLFWWELSSPCCTGCQVSRGLASCLDGSGWRMWPLHRNCFLEGLGWAPGLWWACEGLRRLSTQTSLPKSPSRTRPSSGPSVSEYRAPSGQGQGLTGRPQCWLSRCLWGRVPLGGSLLLRDFLVLITELIQSVFSSTQGLPLILKSLEVKESDY